MFRVHSVSQRLNLRHCSSSLSCGSLVCTVSICYENKWCFMQLLVVNRNVSGSVFFLHRLDGCCIYESSVWNVLIC